jgi:transcriptional regulator with XRE-family HTH domain
MIRFNLLKLLEKLEAKEGRRITLKEVSEKSGCDKNALSRLANHPEIVPSANVIDKLAQYFFFELTRDEGKPHLDRNRIKSVIKDLVWVYPDSEEFWAEIPQGFRDNPNVPLSDIWALYTKFKTPIREKSPKDSELRSSLKTKLLEAEKIRQEGGDIELSLTPEELDLLRANLLPSMGGTAKS